MSKGGIYLFLGPDRYRKLKRVEALAQALAVDPLDRHDIIAAGLSAISLAALAREHPWKSPARFIVIDEAQRLDGACVNLLQEKAEALQHTACLILLAETEISADEPLGGLKAKAVVENFAWLSPPQVSRWIAQHVSTLNKQIAYPAVQDLLQIYGADLAGIRSILDQVLNWIGPRTQITQADVRIFVPALRGFGQSRAFDLVNAIANRDLGMALRAVQGQLMAGREVLDLLGLLVWQLQRWLTVGRLVEAGVLRERIAALTGIQDWQLERVIAELAGRSVASLKRAFEQCWGLDVALKSGRVAIPRAALEGLIVQLCLGRVAA